MTAAATGQAHLQRWVTGLTALGALIACVVVGGGLLALVVGAAALAALWEYFRITSPGRSAAADPIRLLAFAAAMALILLAHLGRAEWMLSVVAGDLVLCGALALREFARDRSVLERTAVQVQGLVYIGMPLALVVLMRAAPDGTTWVFLTCAVVFAGDTAALYTGTVWGRRKLCPAISPGKTIEGAAGGLAASLLVGLAGGALFLPGIGWGAGLVFALGTGLAGQAGDLFESALKRAAGVKDSGALLPGHGGVLDRIDALLFAIPAGYLVRTALAL